MPVASGGERFVGTLQNPQCSDVNLAPCGHLPIPGQVAILEAPEGVPGRPCRYQPRIDDQRTRGPSARLEDAAGFAGLDEQRLVVVEAAERGNDRVVRPPGSRRLAGATVHDQIVGRSATSGPRLFISMRSAASCSHPLHERPELRGARMRRVPIVMANCWTRVKDPNAKDQKIRRPRDLVK